ncbi:MAG: hypothetical protein GF317_06000 [Candidatus Lokiarchaeota archaeon]|nr:hypothetical protein [Candidatus Lokiarchaeota archaeon]
MFQQKKNPASGASQKVSLDKIKRFLGRELFKEYKRLIRRKMRAEINEKNKILEKVKKELNWFKKEYNLYRLEISEYLKEWNSNLLKGEIIKIPRKYKEAFEKSFKFYKCPKCGTLKIIMYKDPQFITCERCEHPKFFDPEG